jgi:hypothetical protein
MAKNLKQLPAITTVEPTDLMYLVRPGDPDSTADKQMAIDAFFGDLRAYGQLYLDLGVNPQQGFTTTPQVITAYDNTGINYGMTADDTTGLITVDAGTHDGIALVTAQISVEGSANTIHNFAIYKDAAITPLAAVADMTNNSVNSMAVTLSGIASFTAGDSFAVYGWSGANSTVTFNALVLSVTRV